MTEALTVASLGIGLVQTGLLVKMALSLGTVEEATETNKRRLSELEASA